MSAARKIRVCSYFTSGTVSAHIDVCAMRKYIRKVTRSAYIRCIQSTHACIDSCIDDSHPFEPGEKEVRNPAMAMRRIIMCEQAMHGAEPMLGSPHAK